MATRRCSSKKKAPVGESRPKVRLQKNLIKTHIKTSIESVIIEKKEVAMSITKTTRKIDESESYDETVNNSVHGCS